MNREGPLLDALTHRLANCPEDFVSISEDADAVPRVVALVSDFFRRYGDANPHPGDKSLLADLKADAKRSSENRLVGILSLVVWIFYDPWFAGREEYAEPMWQFLQSSSLRGMARLLRPRTIVGDPDRREELARECLRGLGLRPQGETIPQATDRLTSLNSVERERILSETLAAEKRAREVREAMARAKALESVSRYGE